MVEVNIINSSYLVLSIVVAIGSIGGLLYQLGRWVNKRSIQAIEQLRMQNELITKQVQEREAQRIKDVDEISKAVMDTINEKTDKRVEILEKQLGDIQDMLRELKSRRPVRG